MPEVCFAARPGRRLLACGLIIFLLSGAAAAAGDTAGPWLLQGRPSPSAQQAVRILQQAGDDGLNPDDYAASGLANALDQATHGEPLSAPAQSALASALEDAMRRYLHDLRYGRIDPAAVYANFKAPPKTFDEQALLKAALDAGNLATAVRAATPRFPLYAALKPWLARFRALDNDPSWASALPPLPGKKLVPGQGYAGTAVLAARLVSLGDVAPEVTAPALYAGVLVDGIRQFQARHGLMPDGVIGKATFAQLNVPPAARVGQIELTMERLRWTPLMTPSRMLLVNLPEFVLRSLDIDGARVEVRLQMNVIVGKALNTRTPLFAEQMRQIEFSPYWKVPQSIANSELVPRLRRDPAYFDREGFEFVTRSGEVVSQLSDELLAAVLRGDARLRQRPGPRNALGNIKFIFPNSDSVYLHHTPAVELFRQNRRDLSHGCIRVENPLALAAYVLQDEPAWTREKILQAMQAGQSRTIRLNNPVTVVIAYGTAIVKQGGGPIYFYPDIYGHDHQLKIALQEYSKTRRRHFGNLQASD